MRPKHVLLVVGAVATLLAGCNDDGRTLAPAPTVAVSPETTSTTQPAVPDPGFTSDTGLVVSSPSFDDGGRLPPDFTCSGLDVSPPLIVTGVPGSAAELAVVVTDRDADGYVHWVVAGLDPAITRIESGSIPPDAVTARTSGGVDGWEGPCPPPDDPPHEYVFTVYATGEPIGLAPGLEGREAVALIEQAAIASNVLVGTYSLPEAG